MSEWIETKWGKIASLEYGKSLKDYYDEGGSFPVYGTNGKIGSTESFLCANPGVIIGRKGAYRGVHFSPTPFFVIDTAFYLKPFTQELSLKYAYYQLKTVDINYMDSGSAIPSTSREDFYDLNISLPPYLEQQAIAEVLSSLDDKIDLLHQNNHTLAQMSETLFQRLFEKENDELRKPSHLGDMFVATIGGEWGKENPDSDNCVQVRCIRGTDIGTLQTTIPNPPIRYVTQKKFEKCMIIPGDIVIEISGGTDDQSTGRAYFFDENILKLLGGKVVFSNFCRLLRPKNSNQTYYLYALLRSVYSRGDFFNLENGTSGIRNLDLKSFLFQEVYPLAEEDDVTYFHNLTASLFTKLTSNFLQIQIIQELRDTLLPKLITGEVKVNLQAT